MVILVFSDNFYYFHKSYFIRERSLQSALKGMYNVLSTSGLQYLSVFKYILRSSFLLCQDLNPMF
jgi:hypothetical protein